MKQFLIGAVLCTALPLFAMDAPEYQPELEISSDFGADPYRAPSAPLPVDPSEELQSNNQHSNNDTERIDRDRTQSGDEAHLPVDAAGGRFSPIIPTQEFHRILRESPTYLSEADDEEEVDETYSEEKENFFQNTSLLNQILKVLIENKNLNAVNDLLTELTRNNDCNLDDVIEEETKQEAEKAFETEEQKAKAARLKGEAYDDMRSAQIYDLFLQPHTLTIDSDTDTTGQAVDRTISKCRKDWSELTPYQRMQISSDVLLTHIENSNAEEASQFIDELQRIKSSTEKLKDLISDEVFEAAAVMRAKRKDTMLLIDEQKGIELYKNAKAIHRKLKTQCDFSYGFFASDSENGSDTDENQDEQFDYSSSSPDINPVDISRIDFDIVAVNFRNAFSRPILESIMGRQRAERITQLLAEERNQKNKWHDIGKGTRGTTNKAMLPD